MTPGDGLVRGPGRLITVAHGTRRPGGNETARAITEAAGWRLERPATTSYVELSEPLLSDVVAALDGPAVVVPLLLSTGFHVRQDLPAMCAGADVVLGRPLGPDPLLAQTQVARLVEAGARPGDRVVLVAAGSRDPVAGEDLCDAVGMLADLWDGEVVAATLSGLGDRPEAVVRPGDAVSPYLLSPGLFSRDVANLARELDASACADVLGDHALVVDLVVERARQLH